MGRFTKNAHFLDVPQNLGALELGLCGSLVFFGNSLVLGYIYYRRFTVDRLSLKILVAILLLLDTFHSVTAIHMIYFMTVNLAVVQAKPFDSYSLTTNAICESLMTLLVQSFFSLRIYRLSQKLTIPLLAWMLAVLRFTGSFSIAIESYLDIPDQPDGFKLLDRIGWLITATFSVGAALDTLIALSMVYYLKQWSATVVPCHPSTAQVVDRLMIWSFQTGVVTCLTSLSAIITFTVMENLVWFSIYLILAKIYSQSLLISLNVRPGKQMIDFVHSHNVNVRSASELGALEFAIQATQNSNGCVIRTQE